MKVGLPLSSALDSPGGNGFRIGSGASRASQTAKRKVKFETAFGANCLGSRKVPLKSHKEPQTKVSRWKAPKESRINVRRGGQSTFANEQHTTTTTMVTATTRSSGSRQNAFGRSWFQLEFSYADCSMQSNDFRIREKRELSMKADASLSRPAGSTGYLRALS